MKKLALLLVLAMAVPAMAAVTFTADGDGSLKIYYTADPGDNPRGVALRISLSDGATCGPDDVVAVNPQFNTYIDYAASNPGNFEVGQGHPLAKATEAGALDAAASEFSVCIGVLDEAGNQAPASDGGPHLLVELNVSADCTATICADTLRGPDSGVVGSVLESNLQEGCIEVAVTAGAVECMKTSHPDYDTWVAVGKPDCWCYARQCKGDADGKAQVNGLLAVFTDDLAVFLNAYGKGTLPEGGICADFDHKAQVNGLLRVFTDDLAIFLANYGKGGVTECDPTHFNFWVEP